MDELIRLWETHRNAGWPESLGSCEGELMMLDTVIAGCVTYFFEEEDFDLQRVEILQDSLSDLNNLIPEIPDDAVEYFERLRTLGVTLLESVPDQRA